MFLWPHQLQSAEVFFESKRGSISSLTEGKGMMLLELYSEKSSPHRVTTAKTQGQFTKCWNY